MTERPSQQRICALILVLVSAAAAPGQTAAEQPAFEVASLKLSPPGEVARLSTRSDAGRVDYRFASLRVLLLLAYGVKEYQIEAPPWISTVLYHLSATFPPGVTRDRKRAMMQALLADRLLLRTHRETRQIPVYELTVAKGGLRMKLADGTAHPARGSRLTVRGRSLNDAMTIDQLISFVSLDGLDRPLLNLTGITGEYLVNLDWLPDNLAAHLPAPPAGAEASAPSPDLFSALEEQLGLKVEKRRSPVEMLVVDSAERIPKEQ